MTRQLTLKAAGLVAGLGLLAACQQAAPVAATASAPAAPGRLVRSVRPAAAWPPLLPLFAPADTLTAARRAVLQAHDLSPLWANTGDASSPNPSFDGFFGFDHYRFGLVFNEVRRDPADPARYLVRGKCNYRKSRTIRPFTGTLTVRQLADLAYPGFLHGADSVAGHLYTARAQLQLQEASAANSGVFEGEILLDFYAVPGQPAGYVYVFAFEGYDDKLPTRGAHLLLRGNRRNVTTGQVKPFLVGPEVAAIAPRIFKDFMLDDRLGEVNPKYARLGWSSYWENDEWWADSPGATASRQ